jgi:regulator of cell morphogenesis and NO signaling
VTITETTTVADIARQLPSSVRVFQRHGIDFCCRGKQPIGAACRERGLRFADIAGAIEASHWLPHSDGRDWSRTSLRALIDHILRTYHHPLQEQLPRLRALASKVVQAHGAKAPQLARVEAIVADLATDLEMHMRKEEMVLFPAIETLEAGAPHLPIPISAPITVMENEHDEAGAMLAELRFVTNGYRVPEWGCATWRALYDGLAELESEMHVHVHLENNVLFPRALQLSEPFFGV